MFKVQNIVFFASVHPNGAKIEMSAKQLHVSNNNKVLLRFLNVSVLSEDEKISFLRGLLDVQFVS